MVKKGFYMFLLLIIIMSGTISSVYASPVNDKGTAKVQGKIKEGEKLLKNTLVLVHEKGKQNWVQLMTDAAGSFNSDLTDGTYTIKGIKGKSNPWYSTDKSFVVKEGKIIGSKDGEIDLPIKRQAEKQVKDKQETRTSFVKGTIKDKATVLKNTQLLVQEKGKFNLIQTDASGSFQSNLSDGIYTVKGFRGQNKEWYSTSEEFSVKEGKVKGSKESEIVITEKKRNKKISDQTSSFNGILREGSKGLKADLSIIKSGEEEIYTVSSKGDGSFSAALPDGEYYLYGIQVDGGTYRYEQSFSIENGKLLIEGKPQTRLSITIPIKAYTGKVSDSIKPLSDADIVLEKYLSENEYDMEFIQDVITNNQGAFSLRALSDGKYSISIYSETYSSWKKLTFEVVKGIIYVDGKKTSSLNMTVPDINLTGTLMEGKNPITNAYISIDGETYGFGMQVDSKGHYQYRLEDGIYRVTYIGEQNRGTPVDIPFEIRKGQLLQNGEISSNLKIDLPPVTLTGKLLDSGKAVQGGLDIISDDGQSYYAATDESGIYSLRLKDGSYEARNGYLSDEGTDIWLSAKFQILNGQLLVDGQEKSMLELQVPPVSLHGTVKEGDKVLTSGYFTVCSDEQSFCSSRNFNSDGTFSMRLADGEYRLDNVQLEDGTTANINQVFSIKDGKAYVNGKQEELLVVSVPPITLKGTLMESGKPVMGGIYITEVNNADNPLTAWASTDENGSFKFRLPDGDYMVSTVTPNDNTEFSPRTEFSIVSGELYLNGQPKDMLEIAVPPITLKGTLSEAGTPLMGQVNIMETNNADNPLQVMAWANEEGKFQSRLPDGDYEVSNVYLQDGSYLSQIIDFTISSGQLYINGQPEDMLNISVPPVTLKGKITDSGNPISGGVSIMEINNPDNPQFLWFGTTEEGSFTARLKDGDYKIYEVNLNDGTSFNPGIEFSIKSGQLYVNGESKDTLEVSPPPITLAGKLTDSGQPIGGNLTISQVNDPNLYTSVWVNEDGKFQCRLKDGDYKVSDVYLNDGASFSPGIEFSINSGHLFINGQPKDILEISAPPISLKGTLTDSGNPIMGQINIESTNIDNPLYFYSSANEEGNFQSRLPDGDYKVSDVYLNDGTTYSPKIVFSIISGHIYVNGELTDLLNITVPPITLSGTVYNGEQVVMDGNVGISSLDENHNSYNGWIQGGTYRVRLPDGEYELSTVYDYQNGSFYFGKKFIISEGKLIVDGQEVNTLDLNLKDGSQQ
ncbi:carboxypeptidase-like regulatory domain-containing protein [Neobacillus terrae]|uniref:carboxypeptidase-like regulatory domain-containing protein n=1 Tax=Neobacillus terrae TaxID=3034837 RepID=UPI0014077383|nr:carboxypeptidase-like regulatory domain-containing protein [Neobacillus terrae]NHM30052.1 carboxypeptidase regulatory-like domain-containing protein [Neobacillus terrae]